MNGTDAAAFARSDAAAKPADTAFAVSAAPAAKAAIVATTLAAVRPTITPKNVANIVPRLSSIKSLTA